MILLQISAALQIFAQIQQFIATRDGTIKPLSYQRTSSVQTQRTDPEPPTNQGLHG